VYLNESRSDTSAADTPIAHWYKTAAVGVHVSQAFTPAIGSKL